jgi:hypothetical protein
LAATFCQDSLQLLHAQAISALPVDVEDLDLDFLADLTISGRVYPAISVM